MNSYIFTEFAPLEQKDDAILSLSLLVRPWTWKRAGKKEELITLLTKNYLQLPDSVAMNTIFFHTGRSALYHFFQTRNLSKNSTVAVQAFTCSAVILPLLQLGLKPRYIDIEKVTFSMNIDSLKQQYHPEMKVLILQHSFGVIPAYRHEILAFAKEKGIIIIEDMAHGIDPQLWQEPEEYEPKNMLLSFGRSKSISSVFGGAIVTNDKTRTEILQKEADKLPFPSSFSTVRILLYKPLSVFIQATYPIGLGKIIHKISSLMGILDKELSETEIQGNYDIVHDKQFPEWSQYLLINQLRKYGKQKQQRNEIFGIYKRAFPFLHQPNGSRCPLIVSDVQATRAAAAARHIFLGTWYSQPVDPNRTSLKKMQYQKGSCPEAEEICQHVVNLPLQVSPDTAKLITDIVKPFSQK